MITNCYAFGTWQRQSFESFRQLLLVREPSIFPCIYATRGFKAQQHLYCFVDSDNPSEARCLDFLANALRSYSERCLDLGPMTSLVILTPQQNQPKSINDYRQIYWDTLRALADLDELPWPDDVPEDIDSPRWCFCFHGQKFVSLAMTPSHTLRRSRHCPCFCIVFQPLAIFEKLMPTRARAEAAVGIVRKLTDVFDDVDYSADVRAVSDGTGPMSNIFFINDSSDRSSPPFAQIKSRSFSTLEGKL